MLKAIIGGVADEVEGGGTLSDAMAKYPKAFDKLYVNMINAGEAGGVLDLILHRLADFMEKAAKLKKKVIGAMIYPAVVITHRRRHRVDDHDLRDPEVRDRSSRTSSTELPGITQILLDVSRWFAKTTAGRTCWSRRSSSSLICQADPHERRRASTPSTWSS